MLERLDTIDWAALRHAYGSAKDVPGQLRALVSGDERACGQALYELWGNIHHQGSVYEATVYAVPFLVAIAVEPGSEVREDVLILVGAIAHGWSYPEGHAEGVLGRRVHDGVWSVCAGRAIVME